MFKGRIVVKDKTKTTCLIAEKDDEFETNLIRHLAWMIDQQHIPHSEIASVAMTITWEDDNAT